MRLPIPDTFIPLFCSNFLVNLAVFFYWFNLNLAFLRSPVGILDSPNDFTNILKSICHLGGLERQIILGSDEQIIIITLLVYVGLRFSSGRIYYARILDYWDCSLQILPAHYRLLICWILFWTHAIFNTSSAYLKVSLRSTPLFRLSSIVSCIFCGLLCLIVLIPSISLSTRAWQCHNTISSVWILELESSTRLHFNPWHISPFFTFLLNLVEFFTDSILNFALPRSPASHSILPAIFQPVRRVFVVVTLDPLVE